MPHSDNIELRHHLRGNGGNADQLRNICFEAVAFSYTLRHHQATADIPDQYDDHPLTIIEITENTGAETTSANNPFPPNMIC